MIVVGIDKRLIDIDWLSVWLMPRIVGRLSIDADFGEEVSNVVEFPVLELKEAWNHSVLVLAQGIYEDGSLIGNGFESLKELLTLPEHNILNLFLQSLGEILKIILVIVGVKMLEPRILELNFE